MTMNIHSMLTSPRYVKIIIISFISFCGLSLKNIIIVVLEQQQHELEPGEVSAVLMDQHRLTDVHSINIYIPLQRHDEYGSNAFEPVQDESNMAGPAPVRSTQLLCCNHHSCMFSVRRRE